jgi:uncharacterized protein
MEYFIIGLVALLASLLTFFSGFGLGTLLMPAFAIFFPLDIAIALTGVVHLANNLFKWVLVRKHIEWPIALKFGLPAMLAALAGAWVLLWINQWATLFTWQYGDKVFSVTPIKLLIAFLLLVFAFLEMSPRFANLQIGADTMIYGGLLSGFFGGLSGHQGALRSAFLLKAGLSKESYIATGVMIACFIDVSRLAVYAGRFRALDWTAYAPLIISATLAAFIGAFAGSRLLKKVTMKQVQFIVTIALSIMALGLGSGII